MKEKYEIAYKWLREIQKEAPNQTASNAIERAIEGLFRAEQEETSEEKLAKFARGLHPRKELGIENND